MSLPRSGYRCIVSTEYLLSPLRHCFVLETNGGCLAKCHLFSQVNGLLITVLQWTIAFHTEAKIGSQENLLRGVYFES